MVDADLLAREVVERGTPGLAAVVEAFGREMLRPDGALDREALGREVFGDDDARRRLNGLLHPLIGARTLELAAQAQADGATVLAHDVPLLVENGLAPGYHLVLVVQAPLADRLHRLTDLRGIPEHDARARMAAQADDATRREAADVVLVNDGTLDTLEERTAALWRDRIAPYADNLTRRRSPDRPGVDLVDPDPGRSGRRLVARLSLVCGGRATGVEHVSGRATDVLTLEVETATTKDAEALVEPLADGGFPRVADADADADAAVGHRVTEQGWRRLHRGADPGRAVDVQVLAPGDSQL